MQSIGYSEEDYLNSCAERAQSSGYYFSTTKDGFESKIILEDEDLVFYSVPYDSGWSAYVNGKETEIVKANLGFMAVRVPKGDNEIVFKYMPSGLIIGIYLTIACIIILALYLGIIFYLRKKYPQKYSVKKYAHKNILDAQYNIKNKKAYIKSVTNLQNETKQ